MNHRYARIHALAALVAAVFAGAGTGCSRSEPRPVAMTKPSPPPPVPPAKDPAPTQLAGPLADAPAGLADVVYLPADLATPAFADPFARELARQALGLTAREEFGLRVGDAALGEDPPAGLPADRHLLLRGPTLERKNPGPDWMVAVGPDGRVGQVWEASMHRELHPLIQYQFKPAAAVEAAERVSRGVFKECLRAARFAAKPAARSTAPAPPAAEELLGRMRETAQFAAVRLLHAEVRAAGESDALVGALARGYAHLAILTEFHWTPAPAAFKARALLYAQRLVARSPASASARWHRAYAAAFAGLHHLALDDLAAADKLAAQAKADRPAWVEPLAAYLRFDADRFQAIRARADSPLVRLLEYLAAEEPETPTATIRAGRTFLAAEPECYRVHDGQCRVGGVSHLHGATVAGPEAFTKNLDRRIREQPGLPPAVVAALDRAGVTEPELYDALAAAGDRGSDRGEPSWTTLGGLLREVRFCLAVHRLEFVAYRWAVPAGDEAAGAAAALAGHPLRALVESFAIDPVEDPEGLKKLLLAAPVGRLDPRALAYYARLRRADPKAAWDWYGGSLVRETYTYREVVRALRINSDDPRPRSANGLTAGLAERVRQISPHAPLAAAWAAVFTPPEDALALTVLERTHPTRAVVHLGLGRRHLSAGRTDDAIRCWRRAADLSPDARALFSLASAYEAKGDEAAWKATVEEVLRHEDTGLNHAWARVVMAEHYMARKDFSTAEPYAVDAAESYAGWALLCAARCKEGLEKWDEANEIYRATAMRYRPQVFDWYFACRESGRMDVAAAAAAARDYLAGLGVGLPPDLALAAGRFHLLAGQLREARAHFKTLNPAALDPYENVFLALVADAAEDAAWRDKAVSAAADTREMKDPGRVLAGTLKVWLGRAEPPDAAAVEAVLAGLAAGPRADAEFFIGWYLSNRGLADRAAGHWRRCALSPDGQRWLRTHATGFLDEREKAGKSGR